MPTSSFQRRSSFHYYWHAMIDGSTLSHEVDKATIVRALQQLEMLKVWTYRAPQKLAEEHWKNGMTVASNFLIQYQQDGNDFLKWIIIEDESWFHFYELERNLVNMVWGEKKREKGPENSRMSGLPGWWC